MRKNTSSTFGSYGNFEDVQSSCSTMIASTSNNNEADPEYTKFAEKCGRFFSLRLFQILVQSRTNEKFATSCSDQSDWFHMNVDELGEVTAQIKKSLTQFPPAIPEVSIDFSLYTVDQDTLPLESWTFSVDESRCKEGITSDQTQLHYELGTLLRSVMVAARMTPMHRYYVKKQSADTFVILYRIFAGKSTIDLGPNACRKNLGQYPSCLGAFKLDYAYRTKMEIDRTISPADNSDSFTKISHISHSNTPDSLRSGNIIAESPLSYGNFSNFSTSPPTSSPICSPPDSEARFPANLKSRSRTVSVDSDQISIDSKPAKTLTTSHSVPKIPKNMPFANLLTMSYTGALFPLPIKEVDETENNAVAMTDSDKTTVAAEESLNDPEHHYDAQDNEDKPEEEQPTFHLASSPSICVKESTPQSDEQSPLGSMCATLKAEPIEDANDVAHNDSNLTLSNENATEEVKESDDDSFVKVPIFHGGATADSADFCLSSFINSCKAHPELEFCGEDFDTLSSELMNFSTDQGRFDRFVAEVRELVEKDTAF